MPFDHLERYRTSGVLVSEPEQLDPMLASIASLEKMLAAGKLTPPQIQKFASLLQSGSAAIEKRSHELRCKRLYEDLLYNPK